MSGERRESKADAGEHQQNDESLTEAAFGCLGYLLALTFGIPLLILWARYVAWPLFNWAIGY